MYVSGGVLPTGDAEGLVWGGKLVAAREAGVGTPPGHAWGNLVFEHALEGEVVAQVFGISNLDLVLFHDEGDCRLQRIVGYLLAEIFWENRSPRTNLFNDGEGNMSCCNRPDPNLLPHSDSVQDGQGEISIPQWGPSFSTPNIHRETPALK